MQNNQREEELMGEEARSERVFQEAHQGKKVAYQSKTRPQKVRCNHEYFISSKFSVPPICTKCGKTGMELSFLFKVVIQALRSKFEV